MAVVPNRVVISRLWMRQKKTEIYGMVIILSLFHTSENNICIYTKKSMLNMATSPANKYIICIAGKVGLAACRAARSNSCIRKPYNMAIVCSQT